MITVEQTEDEEYIKSVFLNPTIYARMKDDSCPETPSMLSDANIMDVPGFFLKAIIDGVSSGVWWLIWKGDKVEAHTALLENCRGRSAIDATKMAIQWVFDHTRADAITSYAWSDSPSVSWFCRSVGMKRTVTMPWASTRNSRRVDITYYEISRGEKN